MQYIRTRTKYFLVAIPGSPNPQTMRRPSHVSAHRRGTVHEALSNLHQETVKLVTCNAFRQPELALYVNNGVSKVHQLKILL